MSSRPPEPVAGRARRVGRHGLCQALQFVLQVGVAEPVREQGLQLRALVGRQGIHERLRRRHLLAHLLEQLIQRSRRVVAEHVAVLVHEVLEERLHGIRVDALRLLGQEIVQVLQHVLHALDVALGHVVDHVLDIVEERLRHGPAQLVEKLDVALLRLRIQELVALELLHLAGGVVGQLVEPRFVLLGDIAHDVAHELVPFAVQPLLDGVAFQVENLVEFLLDFLEHARQVEAVEVLALLFPQLPQHVAQPLHVATLGNVHAAGEQVAHRPAQVAVFHEVVDHGAKRVVRIDAGRLAAVPLREPVMGWKPPHRSAIRQPVNTERPALLFLLSSLCRCRPSSTNSIADARAAATGTSASDSTAASSPSSCSTISSYSALLASSAVSTLKPSSNARTTSASMSTLKRRSNTALMPAARMRSVMRSS